MASESPVLTDNSVLSRLDQALECLEKYLALLGGVAVFVLMLLAVTSVAGRQLFNQPLAGYVDWIEQAMPVIAFLGIAYCQRLGGHIRMDMLIGRLRGRALWCLELLGCLLTLLLMLLLVWGTWAHFDRSFDFAAPLWSRDSSLDIRLPLWPAKLLVPVAFAVLSARLVLQCVGYARALVSGERHPVAVPLIEDAATLAEREAQATLSTRESQP
ncbi:MAG: TRAP transporter small permease subunit [Granulosicoccaceae bacterium]